MRLFWSLTLLTLTITLSSCTGLPQGIKPVNDFELNRYLGQWYEIARLDHRFERGLSHVTANYSLREDGGVSVINRGFSNDDKQWQQAEGKAYFVNHADEGYLKVSFFGPFYGSYVIFELDKQNYQYAFISGPDRSYLWFLSRTPTPDKALIEHFIQTAQSLGFNTDSLIFVEHG